VHVRLASWNVHSCVGTDGVLDVARIGDVLERLDVDVIGLQEIERREEQILGLDQLAYLARRLDMHPIAGPNLIDHRGDFGNGLLARRVPRRHVLLDLSVADREPRGAIDALFDLPGGPLRVVVTHLGLGRVERAQQIRALREHLSKPGEASGPVVLLGDLNEWRPGLLTRSRLVPDPFEVASGLRTWPSRRPLLRLDRILAAPRPRRFEAHTVTRPAARVASDHLPVVADVEWPDDEHTAAASRDADGQRMPASSRKPVT
jgi:endonuclease/exonuclease/phosphatase family metal-dependent hydrolase